MTRPWATAAACLVAAVSGLSCGDGGARARSTRADRPDQPAAPAAEPAPKRPTLAAPTDSSLESMALRVAAFVGAEAAASRRRLVEAGLIAPDRLTVELHPAPAEKGTARRALLVRVAEAVTAALGGAPGVAVRGRSAGGREADAVLHADVETDLDGSFRRFGCVFDLEIDGRRRSRRDAFDSEGLVRLTAPKGVAGPVVVRAVRRDFACEFEAPERGAYFVLPTGPFETLDITLPSAGGRRWSPPGPVLLHNVWAVPAAAATAEPTAARPTALVLPLPDPPAAPTGQASLTILSPAPGQRVPRFQAVAGRTDGLPEGTVVTVAVVVGGELYEQDGRALVGKDSRWRVGRCIFGRVGTIDVGKTFAIVAQARAPDGRVVRSPIVRVVRR